MILPTKRIVLPFVGVLLVVISLTGLYGLSLYRGWSSIDRVEFDTSAAREALRTRPNAAVSGSPVLSLTEALAVVISGAPAPTNVGSESVPPYRTQPPQLSSLRTPPVSEDLPVAPSPVVNTAHTTTTFTSMPTSPLPATTEPPTPTLPPPPIDSDGTRVFLIIGNDSRPPFSGNRADVTMLAIIREDLPPILTSLPRDLYIENPCKGYPTRINVNLAGCRSPAIDGPSLLAVAVEDFTGLTIDHFIMVGWEGFTQIIDAVGGVEICTDRPLRDRWSNLELDTGCTLADGDLTFAWVRSRKTQQYVNGSWSHLPGASDLARNLRQQELMVKLLVKVKDFSSPFELLDFTSSLSEAFAISDNISLTDMVSLAWSLRATDPTSIIRFELPVKYYTTPRGASVLLPKVPFQEAYDQAIAQYLDDHTAVEMPDHS